MFGLCSCLVYERVLPFVIWCFAWVWSFLLLSEFLMVCSLLEWIVDLWVYKLIGFGWVVGFVFGVCYLLVVDRC